MRPAEPAVEVWWDATADVAPRAWPLEAVTWAYMPRDTSSPADSGYWTATRRAPVVTWPERDPAPTVTSMQPRPEGAPGDPSAVLKLVRAAEAAGWPVRVGYSRGLLRTRSVGRYKDVEIIGVWAGWANSWRWCAMYERTVGAATGWKWGAITAWQSGRPLRSGLTITALYQLLFRAEAS